MKKRALISVSDKTGIVEFVKELVNYNYEVISTGGTYKVLKESGIDVLNISKVTGFPEILDGRVKTLHPLVHGGLLAIRDNDAHINEVKENNIEYIDMVVVNLYPFKETISKESVDFSEAIENIDIGGPSMLRSAAKNHQFVTVLCDASDYEKVLQEIKINGEASLNTKKLLAAKVFRHTAKYDSVISNYLTNEVNEEFPESVTFTYDLKQNLRYGENPHQNAAFYASDSNNYSLASSTKIQGKELSYNNIQDSNAALQIISEFKQPAVVALKHMNPCGVGVGKDILEAWHKAYDSDKVSIFGGIISTNQEVDEQTAKEMVKIFLEVIIAPSFTKGALSVFKKKKNLRLLTVKMGDIKTPLKQLVSVNGGLLIQNQDAGSLEDVELEFVTEKIPSKEELDALKFAWKVVKHVKSNAIVLAKDNQTVGVGAGQMNRVGAAKLAFEWAKENGHNSNIVLASDAFFPFNDVVSMARKYGITAIIQPGGSIRDTDSINKCNELGISMVFTKMRHFKH